MSQGVGGVSFGFRLQRRIQGREQIGMQATDACLLLEAGRQALVLQQRRLRLPGDSDAGMQVDDDAPASPQEAHLPTVNH